MAVNKTCVSHTYSDALLDDLNYPTEIVLGKTYRQGFKNLAISQSRAPLCWEEDLINSEGCNCTISMFDITLIGRLELFKNLNV